MAQTPQNPSLSIFFPCYNDRGTIQKLVKDAIQVACAWTDDYEILVIDDGSSDGSREVLKNLATKIQNLRLIFHERNLGYGAAVQTGFREARKNWIFYTDGDGQYEVSELKSFFPLMTDGFDLVNGYKIKRQDPWYRKILGAVYYQLTKILFQIEIRDINCDFRLLRRRIFERIKLETTSGAIGLELIKKTSLSGFQIAEHPVHHYPRVYGHSQFLKPGKIAQTFADLIRLKFKLKRQKENAR